MGIFAERGNAAQNEVTNASLSRRFHGLRGVDVISMLKKMGLSENVVYPKPNG